jgi:hypothetical protein
MTEVSRAFFLLVFIIFSYQEINNNINKNCLRVCYTDFISSDMLQDIIH